MKFKRVPEATPDLYIGGAGHNEKFLVIAHVTAVHFDKEDAEPLARLLERAARLIRDNT